MGTSTYFKITITTIFPSGIKIREDNYVSICGKFEQEDLEDILLDIYSCAKESAGKGSRIFVNHSRISEGKFNRSSNRVYI